MSAIENSRAEFEEFVSSSPFEYSTDRYPDSAAFPGTYKSLRVDLAWNAWCEARKEVVSLLEANNGLNGDYLAAIAEAEQLRASLGKPDEITAEPHADYDCLKKQYLALRSIANSKCRMADHWSDQCGKMTRDLLLTKGGIIDAERNTNAMLTEQLLKAEQERDELRRLVEAIPEGCTPADARVLREANHALVDEVARLRLDVQNVVDANEEYHDDALALEKERDELADEVERLRNDVMRTEQENALLIAALKKEQDSVDGLNGRIVRLESRVAELEAEKWNAQIAEGALASVEQERDELRRQNGELLAESATHVGSGNRAVRRIKAEAVRQGDALMGQGEAVAFVGDAYSLHWIGSGPIAPIIERTGLKPGDKLYTQAPAVDGAVMRDDENSFYRGAFVAIATLVRCHGPSSYAGDIIRQLNLVGFDCSVLELEEFDLEPLREINDYENLRLNCKGAPK